MNKVTIEVGGESHRLVREMKDSSSVPIHCDMCSLYGEDCLLACTEYAEDSRYDYYFIKEEEDYESN